MNQSPYSVSFHELAAYLNSDLTKGLSETEAKARLSVHGPNEIPKDRPKSKWQILLGQFLNPVFYILMGAAIVAFLLSEWLDGIAILIVIAISVAIGFLMEIQALRSLNTLRKIGQPSTRIMRSGKIRQIRSADLVPGDILVLQPGDVIAADARLFLTENLLVKEAVLTGESTVVPKTTEVLAAKTRIMDQKNMVFKGTMVSSGFAKAIVAATGSTTALGKIQELAAGTKKERTPLEKKLNQLSGRLIWLTLIFILIIVVLGYQQGKDLLLMVETGVALAVAAIPEGLPVVATIALAQGMIRLSKKQVIIKKLEAVEALGATNIICTDKTGTLTEDKMKVHLIAFENGEIKNHPETVNWNDQVEQWQALQQIVMCSVLCNNVDFLWRNKESDSIESALLDFAIETGIDPSHIRKKHPKILEIPFDAESKLMVTAHQNQESFAIYAKGAFEKIIARCDSILTANGICALKVKHQWKTKVGELASRGLRILAFAFKRMPTKPGKEELLDNLTFLGLIGFIDPARNDVAQIIDTYKHAGIRVVMITGDHPKTSEKIAKDIGLLEEEHTAEQVVHGGMLERWDPRNTAVSRALLKASVFARATPKQKLDLIQLYQEDNSIVGMIGDGINDVPALKKADIGIAMGIRGTEAAREVADMILKNDRFAAIALAIHQGRVIFYNIRQFVVYLLSCNLAEILIVGIAALANLPAPLLPLQILFLNLITDTFPALALGLGKGEQGIMNRPPKDPKEPILSEHDWYTTVAYGLAISITVLGVVGYSFFVLELPANTINNMAFYTLVFTQLLNVFNMPKYRSSMFRNEVTQNPWVWAALTLSLLLTFGAYFIPPVASALSLYFIPLQLLLVTIGFSFGFLLLSQVLKHAGLLLLNVKRKTGASQQ